MNLKRTTMITITINYNRGRNKAEFDVTYSVARAVEKLLIAVTNKEPAKTFDEYIEEAARKRT
jgi:hypothetical protein